MLNLFQHLHRFLLANKEEILKQVQDDNIGGILKQVQDDNIAEEILKQVQDDNNKT